MVRRWAQSFVEQMRQDGRQELQSPGGAAEFIPSDPTGRPERLLKKHNEPIKGFPSILLPNARLAAAGSFMSPGNAGVENAIWSGLDAADRIFQEISARIRTTAKL